MVRMKQKDVSNTKEELQVTRIHCGSCEDDSSHVDSSLLGNLSQVCVCADLPINPQNSG